MTLDGFHLNAASLSAWTRVAGVVGLLGAAGYAFVVKDDPTSAFRWFSAGLALGGVSLSQAMTDSKLVDVSDKLKASAAVQGESEDALKGVLADIHAAQADTHGRLAEVQAGLAAIRDEPAAFECKAAPGP